MDALATENYRIGKKPHQAIGKTAFQKEFFGPSIVMQLPDEALALPIGFCPGPWARFDSNNIKILDLDRTGSR